MRFWGDVPKVCALKIFIEISPERYYDFLNRCDAEMPEYAILKNAVVLRDGPQRIMELLCDTLAAQRLLTTAETLRLPIAEDIQRALSPLRCS